MQGFARRVAGLGTLPSGVVGTKKASRETEDILIVGAGPSGIALACALAAKGRRPLLVDEGLVAGGSLLCLPEVELLPFAELERTFADHVAGGRVRVALGHVAGGIFGRDVLAVGPEGARVYEACHVVLATGAHDGVVPFEGNDRPGIVSIRALGRLARHRAIAPSTRIAIVATDASCSLGAAWHKALDGAFAVEFAIGTPIAARGARRLRGVTVLEHGGGRRTLEADVVAIDAPRAPAYELPEHAGAPLACEDRGFVVRAPSDSAPFSPGFWAFGEVAGHAPDAPNLMALAERVAAALHAS
jgi:sarcosine oxidase subunit alpha